jgi:hypothetical protein
VRVVLRVAVVAVSCELLWLLDAVRLVDAVVTSAVANSDWS